MYVFLTNVGNKVNFFKKVSLITIGGINNSHHNWTSEKRLAYNGNKK